MNPTNMEHSELFQAQTHIWNHILNYLNSMSLKCAIELGILDAIHNHGNPMTIPDLVAALPINASKAPSIHRLMRVLTHSGFLELKRDGFVLTNPSRLLLKDEPMSVAPFLKAVLHPVLTKPTHSLSSWFKNNSSTPFHNAHGIEFWEYCGYDPKINNLFNEAMASDCRIVSNIITDKCKGVFEGLRSLVDVGGGTGTLTKAIADAFPHLECTVFDLPHVVCGQNGGKNLKYEGGYMFDDIPPAEAMLLKWILHDWSDEECVKILKNCREAILKKNKKDGKVIIIDMVVMYKNRDEEESVETQLLFDMLMMVLVEGKERKEEEWAKLFYDAGFSGYKISHMLGLRSLIEVYP